MRNAEGLKVQGRGLEMEGIGVRKCGGKGARGEEGTMGGVQTGKGDTVRRGGMGRDAEGGGKK